MFHHPLLHHQDFGQAQKSTAPRHERPTFSFYNTTDGRKKNKWTSASAKPRRSVIFGNAMHNFMDRRGIPAVLLLRGRFYYFIKLLFFSAAVSMEVQHGGVFFFVQPGLIKGEIVIPID